MGNGERNWTMGVETLVSLRLLFAFSAFTVTVSALASTGLSYWMKAEIAETEVRIVNLITEQNTLANLRLLKVEDALEKGTSERWKHSHQYRYNAVLLERLRSYHPDFPNIDTDEIRIKGN